MVTTTKHLKSGPKVVKSPSSGSGKIVQSGLRRTKPAKSTSTTSPTRKSTEGRNPRPVESPQGSVELRSVVRSAESTEDWLVGVLQDDPEIPNTSKLIVRAAFWFRAVTGFRENEEEELAGNQNGELRSDHRPNLANLIAVGEEILHSLTQTSLPKGFTKFKPEDMEVELRELHFSMSNYYKETISSKLDQDIAKLFEA